MAMFWFQGHSRRQDRPGKRYLKHITRALALIGVVHIGHHAKASDGDDAAARPEAALKAEGNPPPRQPPPSRPSAGINCTSCHRTDAVFSHPVNINPSMSVPAHLPLENGKITCLTCHESQAGTVEHGASPRGDSLLRTRGPGWKLCEECHSSMSADVSAMHAMNLGQAHLRWDDSSSQNQSKLSQAFTSSNLDPESTSCLSCHDGSVAKDIGYQVPTSASRFKSSIPNGSHPIGITYANSRDSSETPLRPQSFLDSRIRLFDNRLGCGSCHSLYSPHKDKLVMENDMSRLCLSCHDF